MRVVLDTNVIISRYLTPHGRVARIIDLWEANAFDLIVSVAVLSEYDRVLHYPRHRRVHRLTDDQLVDIADAFQEFSVLVVPPATPAVVEEDPDDDHFLAAADAGAVDCLVTGDPHLLGLGEYKNIPVLRPAEFLDRFFPGQALTELGGDRDRHRLACMVGICPSVSPVRVVRRANEYSWNPNADPSVHGLAMGSRRL